MSQSRRIPLLFLMTAFALPLVPCPAGPAAPGQIRDDIVQAQVILTVAESKRLIAKAIPNLPIVQAALTDGMVIIGKGTTNTYVAEELLDIKIEHGAYVYGRTWPEKNPDPLKSAKPVGEFILINGQVQPNLSLADAVKQLKAGDVVIKGANALDYPNQIAAVCTGGGNGGTTGTFMPRQVAQKAYLVIPVGLEKQIAGSVLENTKKMQQPVESLNKIPSMFLLTGHIITEIEAIKTFANVEVFQAAAGGIGGAEGSVRLICRGSQPEVQKVLDLVGTIQGEPPFVFEKPDK